MTTTDGNAARARRIIDDPVLLKHLRNQVFGRPDQVQRILDEITDADAKEAMRVALTQGDEP